jgi:hypothetical protein
MWGDFISAISLDRNGLVLSAASDGIPLWGGK